MPNSQSIFLLCSPVQILSLYNKELKKNPRKRRHE